MWPTDPELIGAWERLVADPDSAGEFADMVLRPLEADLGRQFRHAHPDDVTAAADTAVLAIVRRPEAYDPGRSRLPAFLRLIARRDLANLLAAERRHARGRIPWESVELTHPGRNEPEEAPSLGDSPEVQAVIDGLSAVDRQVLDLIRDGERDTAVFAAVLGIADRPAGEQAAEVKRVKDRIMARLRRAGGGR